MSAGPDMSAMISNGMVGRQRQFVGVHGLAEDVVERAGLHSGELATLRITWKPKSFLLSP
jgi:hypothetical protein